MCQSAKATHHFRRTDVHPSSILVTIQCEETLPAIIELSVAVDPRAELLEILRPGVVGYPSECPDTNSVM